MDTETLLQALNEGSAKHTFRGIFNEHSVDSIQLINNKRNIIVFLVKLPGLVAKHYCLAAIEDHTIIFYCSLNIPLHAYPERLVSYLNAQGSVMQLKAAKQHSDVLCAGYVIIASEFLSMSQDWSKLLDNRFVNALKWKEEPCLSNDLCM